MQETPVWSLGQEDPLEKEMATHSNILAQRILWTDESGGLQFMGLQRVGHDWVTNTRTNTTYHLQVYWICWTSLTVGQVETDFLIISLYILRWNVNYSTGAILWQIWNSLAISFSRSLHHQYSRLTVVTVLQLMGPDMLENPPSLGYYYWGTQKEAIFFEIIYFLIIFIPQIWK